MARRVAGARDTLPEMVEHYVKLRDASLGRGTNLHRSADPILIQQDLFLKNEEIREHLRSLGSPLTKLYGNQVPLFPTIYTLQVRFDGSEEGAITWDSELPVRPNQYKELSHRIHPRAVVYVRYQLHAYSKRQHEEQLTAERLWRLTALAAPATVLGLTWIVFVQRRERRARTATGTGRVPGRPQ